MPPLSDTLLAELSLQAAYELNNHDAYLNVAMFFDALNYGGIAKPVPFFHPPGHRQRP